MVVIEHNLDVMAEADWIIDLGPEGGDGGGRIVAQGLAAADHRATPSGSHTARILAEFLAERSTLMQRVERCARHAPLHRFSTASAATRSARCTCAPTA